MTEINNRFESHDNNRNSIRKSHSDTDLLMRARKEAENQGIWRPFRTSHSEFFEAAQAG